MGGKSESNKCWSCGRAVRNQCSWAFCFKPVKGWTAVPTLILARDKRLYSHTTDSFKITDCPLFIRDEDAKKRKPDDLENMAVERLRHDIVVAAIRDWQKANAVLSGSKVRDSATGSVMSLVNASREKEECESFLRSRWFKALYDLDGESIIEALNDGKVDRISFLTKYDEEAFGDI